MKPVDHKPPQIILNPPQKPEPQPNPVILNPPNRPPVGPIVNPPFKPPEKPVGPILNPVMPRPVHHHTNGGIAGDYLAGLVDKAVQGGTAKELADDEIAKLKEEMAKNQGAVQDYDITPRFLMGVGSHAVIFQGELYERKTALTFPPKETWLDCGAAPAALPRG